MSVPKCNLGTRKRRRGDIAPRLQRFGLNESFGDGIGEEFAATGEDEVAADLAQ